MVHTSLHAFPDDARLWLFAFPRPLPLQEQMSVAQGFEAFQPHWKTHGTLIESAWSLLEDQILAVSERTMGTQPSGCSIDAMLRHTQKLARAIDLEFLDAQQVMVRYAGKLRVVSKINLPALLEREELHAETPVIDLGLLELGALRAGQLERPLIGTWIGRKYKQLLEEAPTAH